jgi:transcriptional regulator with GAF, ATPase, and Fis domain
LAEIVGDSAGIRRLREQLEQILTRAARARRPPPILLRGETGTGKGLVARTLHRCWTSPSTTRRGAISIRLCNGNGSRRR